MASSSLDVGRAAAALRWRPEWPIAGMVALVWAALLAGFVSRSSAAPSGGAAGLAWLCDLSMVEGRAPRSAEARGGAADAATTALRSLGGWTVMAAAMMSPVALPAMRHVGLNSARARRRRAITLAFAGYLGVWVAFGVLALGSVLLLRSGLGVDGTVLLAASLALAAGWQLTRFKRRAIFACRRTVPLPPIGRRADAACVRFGLSHGARGVQSCWALMLVMAALGATGTVWMVALTALIAGEELTLFGRRLVRPSAGVLGLAAALVLVGI